MIRPPSCRSGRSPAVSVPFSPVTAPDHRRQTRTGYDIVAEDYATLIPDLSAETSLDVAMIDDFAGRCLDARISPVADVGCGTGRVSAHLAARGVDIFGVDLSPGMIDVARRTHPRLRFQVGAMEDLPIQDAALGGLLAWYSLIHTAPSRLPAVVSEFARILKPGGWLLTAFQTGEGQRVERSTAYGHTVTMTHYRHAAQQVISVLDTGGFNLHTQLHRSPEGFETTHQAVLLACRR
jgi:SAM-dependent methyltransferase